MPVATKQTKRYRGNQRLLLRRIMKVADEVARNNQRYPEPPQNRNFLLTAAAVANLQVVASQALTALGELWPPLT